ncbi:hypothetical protein NC652_018549 [Populus alba x Populus x berolinensis]|uniref:Uncharacterized protein n=1 Tax=Populus alba x Populus x berolinensis TaxID=444605 RepID=A0AAD6QGD9_9ROSI|nr:hypothetical protein NC652_018549 [Populus alba x Populus x berolinensis]KAJ6989917.1 hypothetical protein NC653_018429 [Populus alba x Populus x berolinensis]
MAQSFRGSQLCVVLLLLLDNDAQFLACFSFLSAGLVH